MVDQLSKLRWRSEGGAELFLASPAAALLILLSVGVGFWWTQIGVLDTFLARVGSSPLHWIHLTLDPLKSAIDWPTGTRNLGKSVPINVYLWLYKGFGVEPWQTMVVFIALELTAMLVAYLLFARIGTPSLSLAGAVVFSLLVSLTSLQYMNLARFGHPFTWGLYYSFAGAARIAGLAFVLRSKPWSATSAFALSITVHPIMGAIGALAGGIVVLSRGLGELNRYLIPAVVMGGLTGGWILFGFAGSHLSGGGIPTEDWYALTAIFNEHWYPFEKGVFTSLYERHWLPLLTLGILYIAIEGDEIDRGGMHREIRLMIVTLAALTVLGLLISLLKPAPVLVKLSLHRASDLMVVLAFLVVFRRLWNELRTDSILQRSLAALLLLSAVMYASFPGMPILLGLAYTLPLVIRACQRDVILTKVVVGGVWFIGLALACFYVQSDFPFNWKSSAWTGVDYAERLWGQLGWWLVFPVWLLFLAPRRSALPQLTLLFWIAIGVVVINPDRTRSWSNAEAQAMLEMQLWARNNTPEDALFMPDPSSYGGWRDVSRRASFGTVKEWLHNAWLYNSDSTLFREGIRRFSLLGLTPQEFYTIESRRDAHDEINKEAARRYYEARPERFIALSREEGVDYFIFYRRRLRAEPKRLKLAFQNDHFAVYGVPGRPDLPVNP